jgi:hypothetical protein
MHVHYYTSTEQLNLPPLPVTVSHRHALERLHKSLAHFNPIQTHALDMLNPSMAFLTNPKLNSDRLHSH